ARALVESGCNKLHVGVESLDPDVLRWMNKGINVKTTQNFFEICKKFGIETLGYFILGSPMETREYRKRLPEMVRKLGVTYPYFNILYPAVNTKYCQMLREDGTFERDYWQDFAENPTPNFEMPLPRTPELQAELQRTVDRYIDIFYGTS
ncbi:MAG: radical SAM protein, partial [Dehalococcoidia bacterium]|nr:radical SAM protein [Dehalococcoidia bacterium]